MHHELQVEKKLEHEVKGMHSELTKVEHEEKKLEAEEHMLLKKEQKIEQEFHHKDSWGEEDPTEKHHNVHSIPLRHHANKEESDRSKEIAEAMGGIMSALKETVTKISHTGPAAEHHKGKILPTHNILKPGAHPKHLNKNEHHKPEHHAQPSHHEEHKPEHHETHDSDALPQPKKIE